ncbi:MAG: HEAT repeat domain-containing protein [Candidatus Riflebacteria bacterium]|nr:HEAT repeat domain-containing protein [Candidatus Riflebacteria bacterium]
MQRSAQELVFDLSSDIEEVRKVAVIWLAQVGDASVLPHLRRLTQDPSTAIRHFARRAIDTIERRTGVRPAGAAEAPFPFDQERWQERLTAQDPAERLAAAQAFEKIPDPSVRRLAAQLLPAESDPQVKGALLKVLGRCRDEADLPLIFRHLVETDATVRSEAVLALEGFYNQSIVDHLLPLVRDPDNRTRANVLLILGRYDEQLVVAPLTEMATSQEVWMKDSALFVARSLATPRCVELMGRMYQESLKDSYLLPKIDRALKELAEKDDPAAQRVLRSLSQGRFQQEESRIDLDRVLDTIEIELREGMEGRERRVQRFAISTPDEFREAIVHADYERRLSAVEAGVNLDRTATAQVFRERLPAESHPFVLSKLVKELGRVGNEADIPAIAACLSHPDGRVRANAVEGLAHIGGEKVYDLVKPLLDDPVPRVKANAARIISRIDRDRAFGTLKQMIMAEAAGVSDSAIHALGEVWTDDVLELLELALGKQNQELRIKIFKVLQRLSTKSQVASQIYTRYRQEGDALLLKQGDVEAMVRMAHDPDPSIWIRALENLKKSPDARALPILERALKDPEPRVRHTAQAALRVRDLELEQDALFYRVGAQVYRAAKKGDFDVSTDLAVHLKNIEDQGKAMDRGGSLSEALTLRNQAMAQLGQSAIVHLRADPETMRQLGLDADVSRIAKLEKLIEDRLQALEEESVVMGPTKVAKAAAVPVEEPMVSTWAVLKSWIASNRGLATGIGVGVTVMALGLFTAYLGRPPVRASWKREVKGVIRLVSAGESLIACDAAGATWNLRAASGTVSWGFSLVTLEDPFDPVTDGRLVCLSAPEGRIVAVWVSGGRKAWDVRVAGLVGPPAVEGGAVYAVGKDMVGKDAEWTLYQLDPSTGRARVKRTLPGDTLFARSYEGGLLVGLRRSIALMSTSLERTIWELPLSADLVVKPLPFEVGGLVVVTTADRALGINVNGTKVWDIPLEAGAKVVACVGSRREFCILSGAVVQVVEVDGKVGTKVKLRAVPTTVHGSRGELFYADAAGEISGYTFKDKTERSIGAGPGAVHDLLRQGPVLFVATGDLVEALPLGVR